MRSKPPFYPQETPDSCVPACLRMVLAALGVQISESKLRQLCDCTFMGTFALNAVDALKAIGFSESRKENVTIGQLKTLLNLGFYPVVYVGMMPIDGVKETHALVVVSLDTKLVSVLDPLNGPRELARPIFEEAFRITNGLAIVVSRTPIANSPL